MGHVVATVAGMSSQFSSVITSIDMAVWEFFVGRPFMTGIAEVITQLGVAGVLLPVSAVLGVLVWWHSRSVVLAVQPFVSVYVGAITISWLKEWTNIARPPQEFWLASAESPSFPSGHAGNTAVFLTAVVLVSRHVAPRFNRHIAMVSFGVWLVMAWTRLALNVHWLSDVVAGGAVGVVLAFVVERIVAGTRSRRESQLQTPG